MSLRAWRAFGRYVFDGVPPAVRRAIVACWVCAAINLASTVHGCTGRTPLVTGPQVLEARCAGPVEVSP